MKKNCLNCVSHNGNCPVTYIIKQTARKTNRKKLIVGGLKYQNKSATLLLKEMVCDGYSAGE
jgi:hypothetical protein